MAMSNEDEQIENVCLQLHERGKIKPVKGNVSGNVMRK
jgi:hypothetical protein